MNIAKLWKWLCGRKQQIADDEIFAAAMPRLRGCACVDEGEYESAIVHLNDAIRIQPDDAVAYRARGLAYFGLHQMDRAIADFTEAIRIDPEKASAYRGRADAYSFKPDYDKAIADYNEAIRLDAGDAEAYCRRANILATRGEWDKAIADYSEAIRIDPQYAEAYCKRGFAYAQNGDAEKAVADLNRGVELDPTCALTYRREGSEEEGNYEGVMAAYQEALESNPGDVKTYVIRSSGEDVQTYELPNNGPPSPPEPDASMSREKSELTETLEAAMKPGENQWLLLMRLTDYSVRTKEEARRICDLLQQIPVTDNEQPFKSRLNALTGLFQNVETSEAMEELQRNGIPELCKIVDANMDLEDERTTNDLLFALKILAMYRTEEGTRQVVKAARKSFRSDAFQWSAILEQFDKDHPHTASVMTELVDPLPADFIAVALLDQANKNAIEEMEVTHPFDSVSGRESLRKWLSSSNTEELSYAHSATVSLPFISHPERNDLLALAMDHPSADVRLEAAWASAKLGNQAGIDLLSRSCLDPNQSRRAMRYLVELGRFNAIPEEAKHPDFTALAEMSEWLAHPQEFGRAPDSLELFDSRTLYWPPTDDRRRLWLFKYHYKAEDEDEEDDVGIGMVGSVTFALFGESTADNSPVDVYALHCCWELERNGDEREPEERTVKAGREILAEYNPDLVD